MAGALAVFLAAGALAQQATQIKTTTVGGFYRVFVDGKQVSQHTTEREAFEQAANEQLRRPGAKVYFDHDYRVSLSTNVAPSKPPADPPRPRAVPRTTSAPQARSELKPPTAGAHGHYGALLEHPNLLRAWTLRQPADYSNMRGGQFPNGINPLARYDASIDAGKISLPPDRNEITGIGGFICDWGTDYSWEVGDRLVVQHDFLISEDFHLFAGEPGDNGRATRGYKFTNLLCDNNITHELRIHLVPGENWSNTDVRCYPRKGEGRQERDEYASDVNTPAATRRGSGGGYDRHPGPDSTWVYGQTQFKHPETFLFRSDIWIRVTYELVRVEEGTRVKVWLADEETEPRLIVASPIDPSLGFLVLSDGPISSWYMELDTSQEAKYTKSMPDRWIGMRNLVVLHGVDGSSVLGGKPVR